MSRLIVYDSSNPNILTNTDIEENNINMSQTKSTMSVFVYQEELNAKP